MSFRRTSRCSAPLWSMCRRPRPFSNGTIARESGALIISPRSSVVLIIAKVSYPHQHIAVAAYYLGQRADRAVPAGRNKLRRNLGQRYQHERALGHARVGYGQFIGCERQTIV